MANDNPKSDNEPKCGCRFKEFMVKKLGSNDAFAHIEKIKKGDSDYPVSEGEN